jgi:hypothetical protein
MAPKKTLCSSPLTSSPPIPPQAQSAQEISSSSSSSDSEEASQPTRLSQQLSQPGQQLNQPTKKPEQQQQQQKKGLKRPQSHSQQITIPLPKRLQKPQINQIYKDALELVQEALKYEKSSLGLHAAATLEKLIQNETSSPLQLISAQLEAMQEKINIISNKQATQGQIQQNIQQNQAIQVQTAQKSYAAVAKAVRQPITTTSTSISNQQPQQPHHHQHQPQKQHKIILLSPVLKKEDTDYSLREKLNKALGAKLILQVSLTSNKNLQLFPTEAITPQDLLNKQDLLLKAIQFTKAIIPSPFKRYQVVIHQVPINYLPDPKAISQEIQDYYEIKPQQVLWLTSQKKREESIQLYQGKGNTWASVLVTVATAADELKLLQTQLFLAGQKVIVRQYTSIQKQCSKCQSFGHISQLCKQKEPTCGLCAGPHWTATHKCSHCELTGKLCSHVSATCSNCKKANLKATHEAKSLSCPLQPKTSPTSQAKEA